MTTKNYDDVPLIEVAREWWAERGYTMPPDGKMADEMYEQWVNYVFASYTFTTIPKKKGGITR